MTVTPPATLESIKRLLSVNPITGNPASGRSHFSKLAVTSSSPHYLTSTLTGWAILPDYAYLPSNIEIGGNLTVDGTLTTTTISGLAPSGDTSGATDTAVIQNALNSQAAVTLQPGTFYTNLPLTVPAGVFFRGTKGATPSVYDGAPPANGTIIKGSTSWATGGLGAPCVVLINGSGAWLHNFWIDATNITSAPISNVDGINDGAGFKAVDIRNVGVYNVSGRGIAQLGTAWHMFECLVNVSNADGFYGSWTDSILVNCHGQTCGLNGAGAAFTVLGAESKFIGCRGDLSQYGFTIDAATFNSTFTDVVQLIGCSTQRNNRFGYRIYNSSGTGQSGRCPVVLSGCVADADGINGTVQSNGTITSGVGGGGYSGLYVAGQNTVFVDGFIGTAATRDVGGGCPQYGFATATNGSGPGLPALVAIDRAFFNGITAAMNDAAPAAKLQIGSGVYGYSGGVYTNVPGTVPVVIGANGPGSVLADFEYAPATQVLLIANTTTFAVWTIAATTVAAGSNGGTISNIAAWANPSPGVLAVATTTGWPPSGTVSVATSGTTAVVTYTGIAAGQLTGCAFVSGSGTVSTGGAVTLTSTTLSSGAFTFPPSGKVKVLVQANLQTGTASGKIYLNISNHGSLTPVSNRWECTDGTSGVPRSYLAEFNVTGSAGSSGNFDLLGAADSGHTSTLAAIGDTAGTPSTSGGCPVRITVIAL